MLLHPFSNVLPAFLHLIAKGGQCVKRQNVVVGENIKGLIL